MKVKVSFLPLLASFHCFSRLKLYFYWIHNCFFFCFIFFWYGWWWVREKGARRRGEKLVGLESETRKKNKRKIKSFQMLSHARDPSPDRKCKLRIEKCTHKHTRSVRQQQQQLKKWRNKSSKNQKQSKRVEMNECEWFIQTALTWLSQHYVVDVVATLLLAASLCLEKNSSRFQIFLNMISYLNKNITTTEKKT